MQLSWQEIALVFSTTLLLLHTFVLCRPCQKLKLLVYIARSPYTN